MIVNQKKLEKFEDESNFDEILEELTKKINEEEKTFILLDGIMSGGKSQFSKKLQDKKNYDVIHLDENFKKYQDFNNGATKLLQFSEKRLIEDIENIPNNIIVVEGIGSVRVINKLYPDTKKINVYMINLKNENSNYIYNHTYKDFIIKEIEDSDFYNNNCINLDLSKLDKDEISDLYFKILKEDRINFNSAFDKDELHLAVTTHMEEFNSVFDLEMKSDKNNLFYIVEKSITINDRKKYFIKLCY